jgi:2-methylisocitrate lyase-like PEP mutase family enzyme
MSAIPVEKARQFRALHHGPGVFVIPNPWDVGTARYLAHLKFPALATTSAGMAFSQGLADGTGAVSREMMLAHIAEIVRATDLPVNADFESGYAIEPAGVAESVRLCVHTGVAGLSIEDSTGEKGKPLFELPLGVERIKAARAAIDATQTPVLLTGRAECFLVGHPDPLRESIKRLQAYADAGADVLYAPGVRTREQIDAVVRAVAPKPVNVLISRNIGFTVSDLAELGVRRISVGSGLALVAWGAFMAAARELAEHGSFDAFANAANYGEINGLFRG